MTPEKLDKLAENIKKEHQAAVQTLRKALEHAKKAGEYLTTAKQQIDASDLKWDKWVANNCGFTDRMAHNYIRIAEQWGRIEEAVKEGKAEMDKLTIRAALSLLKTGTRQSKKRSPVSIPRLVDLMGEFEIKGSPDNLLALLKQIGVKLPVAREEVTA